MKKIFLLFFVTLIVWSIKAQIKIPQNTLDKCRIPSWIIVKTSEIKEEKRIEIISNPLSFYSTQESRNVRELNLSKLNNITPALYQLYDSLSYKSNFVMTSIINSEKDQDCEFIFNSFDLESSIYINGIKKVSNDNYEYFSAKLKKGRNEVVIFSKSLRTNLSSFQKEMRINLFLKTC